MAANDALHGGETDARAGKFGGAVKTLKGAEEFFGIGGIEAGAIVFHEEDGAARALLRAELYAGARMARRVFPGVAEEIIQDDAQQARISGCMDAFFYEPFDLAGFVGADEFGNDGARHA